ncbi:MAG: hypothetical protein JJU36_13060 [Phycisphaeraceae bacterium]|nr:hypothetical protein [Phycisphaeraceae bacterium]
MTHLTQALGNSTALTVLCAAIVLAGVAAGFLLSHDMTIVADERFHHRQVIRYMTGDYTTVEELTMPPTYHALQAALNRPFPYPSRITVRLTNMMLGLMAIGLFFLLARQIKAEHAPLRTVQAAFLPILFPFFFVIYTDLVALLLILGATFFTFHRRYNLAGLIGIAVLLVRQNAIPWLAMLVAMSYLEAYGPRLEWRPLYRHALRCWAFALAALAFVVFVVLNHGVAIGDAERHPLGLHRDNIYLFLVCCALLILPLQLPALAGPDSVLRKPWAIATALATIVVAYVDFWWLNPPTPEPDSIFLRRHVIDYAAGHLWAQLLYSALAGAGILALLSIRLQRPSWYLIYPFTLATLIPTKLIEPRYYITTFVFLLLFRKVQRPGWEMCVTVAYAVAAFALLIAIVRGQSQFFL